MSRIDESTNIPFAWLVSFAAFTITTGVGFVFWLSTLYSDVAQAKRDISRLDEKAEVVFRLEKRFIRMETKLGITGPLPE